MQLFITGISRGFGLELAKHFLLVGWDVIGLSRTMTNELQQIINQYGERLKWARIDVGDIDNLERNIYEKLSIDSRPVDLFINNAATLYKNIIHRIDAKQWQQMVNVNTVAPVIITKMMIKNFLHFHTKGNIIHLSSICAHRAFNGLSMMGASKAAIEAFSRTTALEYGRFGIRSNTVVVGLMDTGMRSTVDATHSSQMVQIASQRSLVDYKSVIDIIDFLFDERGRCITGQNINVDCGIV